MTLIAHLSDLHFGSEDPAVAEALLGDLATLAPALVVISGDLTQRALHREFRAARSWLARLAPPWLAVPGNHDLPLYDLVTRALRPLVLFRRYICDDLMPLHRAPGVAVLGVNTARASTWKTGRISHRQMHDIRARLQGLPPDLPKVVVTHHPFVPRLGTSLSGMVGRAGLALDTLEDCGVSLLLAGHLHQGFTGDAKVHYPARRRSLIVAQAGTAISQRLRGEANSYNLLGLDRERLLITVRAWNGAAFADAGSTAFRHTPAGWTR